VSPRPEVVARVVHATTTEKRLALSERDLTAIEALEPTELTALSVAEAMTPEPYTVVAGASLAEVAEKMAEQKYGCVVIVDARGAVLDIFTTNDALHLLAAALPQLSVGDDVQRARAGA
jgi:CBS domain-containing protein